MHSKILVKREGDDQILLLLAIMGDHCYRVQTSNGSIYIMYEPNIQFLSEEDL